MTRHASQQIVLPVRDYDLAATLASGQAFRWREHTGEGASLSATGATWTGIVAGRWVRLRQTKQGIAAETAAPTADWSWLENYLQTEIDLASVLAGFPDDEPMRAAVAACRGLRLLRQEPWECLASFILSSTKQIVQIQQIVALLGQRFGESVPGPAHHEPCFSFPTATRLAHCTESELRECKMGFRAPNLLRSALMIEAGEVNLAQLGKLPVDEARAELIKLPGVGPKIANCVLLFAYGFPEAFPVDVWVLKALRELYFPKRRVGEKRLARFVASHFGPHAGYAQQYLFHYMRTRPKQPASEPAGDSERPARARLR